MSLEASAKTVVAKWFDGTHDDHRLRRKLLLGVDAFLNEIKKRDDWIDCITVLIGDHETPAIASRVPRSRVIPCRDGLAVTTLAPGWGFGWSSILRDEFTYDVLSWFGHYARQYVHRSEIAKILMVAWETKGAVLHPFGAEGMYRRYGADRAGVAPDTVLDIAVADAARQWGKNTKAAKTTRSRWMRRNTLDSGIHQGVFHFLRAQNLLLADFEIEAIVALDCAIQALQSMNWQAIRGNPRHSRTILCQALGLSRGDEALAARMYFLRNQFGAHAGGWRWWDASEELNEAFAGRASRFVLRALKKAADLEPSVRTMDPSPSRWSDWLLVNFARIWESFGLG